MKAKILEAVLIFHVLILCGCVSEHREVSPSDSGAKDFMSEISTYMPFVLNYGCARKIYFTAEDLSLAIEEYDAGKRDAQTVPEKYADTTFFMGDSGKQNVMTSEEFEKLPEGSIFRKLKYNEESPPLITDERRYASKIPLAKAQCIKGKIDARLKSKSEKYSFFIEFSGLSYLIHLETTDEKPRVVAVR